MRAMPSSRNIYIAVTVVFVLSLGLVLVLPNGELIQTLAAIPLVGSLVAALAQILRDQAAHERALTMFAAEKLFSVGASSHMANVAFDKHVAFSEEYVQEVNDTLVTLSVEGPTEKALNHANSLYLLRRKRAVWLTPKLDEDLGRFESALRKLGAETRLVRTSPEVPDRSQWVKSMYKVFADVMGAEHMGASGWDGEDLTEELAISTVIGRLRSILGTAELSEMRSAIISRSMLEARKDG